MSWSGSSELLTSRAVCWLQTTIVSGPVSVPLVFREWRLKLTSHSPADQQLCASAAGYHKAPNTGNESHFPRRLIVFPRVLGSVCRFNSAALRLQMTYNSNN